jgi:hypothetical protein
VSGTALVAGVLTTTAATVFNGGFASNADSTLGTDKKVQFRDAAIYLNSSVDGQLDIVADGEVQIDTALVDINGNLDVSGTTNISGSVSFTKNAIAGVAISTTSRASNTVTVTTSAVHGLTSGDLVNVNGVADTSFNGYFTVSVSSTTVFTYSQTGADGSSTGGTSTEVVYNLNASGTALNWMNGPLNIAANSGIDGLEITQSGAGEALSITGGNAIFGDNDKAVFGAGSDLQIYHDGSDSYIDENGTGNLFIRASNLQLRRADGSQIYLAANTGAEVALYHAGNAKLATTSTGIDVTGVITTDGLTTSADINFADNAKAVFGAGSDLQIYHDGSNSYVKDAGTGVLNVQGSSQVNIGGANGTIGFQFVEGANASLRHNNALKLTTTSTGIDVTGTVVADGLTVDGDASVAGTVGVTADNGTITTGKDSTSGRTHWSMNNPNGEVAKWDSNGTDLLHYITDEYKIFTAGNKAFEIDGNGDISFYEDTGTTAKLFWDASAESLGIGTDSPTASLSLSNSTNDSNGIKMQASGWGYYARSGLNGTSGGQFIQSTNWNANTNTVDSATYHAHR